MTVKAKTTFEKHAFKLMNNAMENVEKWVNVKLCIHWKTSVQK